MAADLFQNIFKTDKVQQEVTLNPINFNLEKLAGSIVSGKQKIPAGQKVRIGGLKSYIGKFIVFYYGNETIIKNSSGDVIIFNLTSELQEINTPLGAEFIQFVVKNVSESLNVNNIYLGLSGEYVYPSVTDGLGGGGGGSSNASDLTSGTLNDARLSNNVVLVSGAQTLTNKTLTNPVINSPTGITKSDIGLSNVDNTSDSNKPVSTAQNTAITAAQNTAISTIKGGVVSAGDTLAKLYALIQTLNAIVGGTTDDGDSIVNTVTELLAVFATYQEGVDILTLINSKLDNTSIVNVLNQTSAGKSLDARQGKVLNDLITSLTSVVNTKVDQISGKSLSTNDYTTVEKNKLANLATVATSGLKSDIGLGNVDNTSDVNKPVSTATSTALSGKEPSITAGTTSQYFRGDKTFQTLNQDIVPDGTTNKAYTATEKTKLAGLAAVATSGSYIDLINKPTIPSTPSGVGLGNVQNVDQTNAANLTSGTVAPARLGTGTAATGKYLDGSGAWTTLPTGGLLTVNTANTASSTAVLADANALVQMNVATSNNYTIPPNSSVAFSVGTQINLVQIGIGQTSFVAGAGVTINSVGTALKLRTQYSTATAIKIGTDTWLLTGDITA